MEGRTKSRAVPETSRPEASEAEAGLCSHKGNCFVNHPLDSAGATGAITLAP